MIHAILAFTLPGCSGIIVQREIEINGTSPSMRNSPKLLRTLCIALLAVALVSGLCASSWASEKIIADIVARCPSQPRSYSQVTDYLGQLAASSNRVQLAAIGYSHQGRPLWLVTVTDPNSPAAGKMRLFIIARQHGNEPAGTTAALALVEHFAQAPSTLEQAVLKRLEIIAVPVANPDGAVANQRRNAAGVDLNRDWAEASQPETQALQAAVHTYRPHAIMDLHELPARTSRDSYRENFIETIGASAGLPPSLYTLTTAISRNISAWMSKYGYGLNVFYDDPGDSLQLCHRYWGLYQGFPTFLCEAKQGPGRPLAYRAGFHILATVVVANYLMNGPVVPTLPQVAQQTVQQPLSPSQPASPSPPQAAPTTMTMQMAPTVDEQGNALVQIMTQVEGGSAFAFVTIEVSGVTKALSNQRQYRYLLDPSGLEPGEWPIIARAYSASEQVLASQQLALTVPASGRGLGQ